MLLVVTVSADGGGIQGTESERFVNPNQSLKIIRYISK